MKISASLVLFHNDPMLYEIAIRSFLEGSDGVLYIVDNSATPLQHALFSHPRVTYLFAGRNLGFGAAHNVALAKIATQSEVHLLLNPDICFGPDVLPALIACMSSNQSIGAVMPRIEYPNGELQRLCKLLPTPLDLIFRRFIPITAIRDRINKRYELHNLQQQSPSDVPTLSGCFLLVRTGLLQRLEGFDERYFMYMEDVDLVRRIGDVARTLYVPLVSVTHDYAKGSYRNKTLLGYHLKSAVKYFQKWGWFYDRIRAKRNRLTLESLKAHKPCRRGGA